METLSEIVFTDIRIVSTNILAKELKCSADEANQLMYEFYQKYKEKLRTFFIVVRQEASQKVSIERLPEAKLNSLLTEKGYLESILSTKLWAFYDKYSGEYDVDHVIAAEQVDFHSIQNLCVKIRELPLKKPLPINKRTELTAASPQFTKKDSLEFKSKSAKSPIKKQTSFELDKNQWAYNGNNGKKDKIKEDDSSQENPKKRKAGVFDSSQAEEKEDYELKRTKTISRASTSEQQSLYDEGSRQLPIEIEDDLEELSISKHENKKESDDFEEEKAEIIHKEQNQHNGKMLERKKSQSHMEEESTSDDTVRVKKVSKAPKDKTNINGKDQHHESVSVEKKEKEPIRRKVSNSNGKSTKKQIDKNQSTLGSFFKKK